MWFLELRDNTGDEARRTNNLNLANGIPDLFMRRVERDEPWSLFDPKRVPALPDLHGEAFDEAYQEAEGAGLAVRVVKARDLYAEEVSRQLQDREHAPLAAPVAVVVGDEEERLSGEHVRS